MNKAPYGVTTQDALILSVTVTAGVVTAAAVGTILSAGAQAASKAIRLDLHDLYSAQFVTTGTVAGGWIAQLSNNDDSAGVYGVPIVGQFTPFTELVIPPATGSPQKDMVRVQLAPERSVQFVFTPSGGTGTAQIWFFAKAIG